MSQVQHRVVETNGIHLRIAEQGSGPLAILRHGFPERAGIHAAQRVMEARAVYLRTVHELTALAEGHIPSQADLIPSGLARALEVLLQADGWTAPEQRSAGRTLQAVISAVRPPESSQEPSGDSGESFGNLRLYGPCGCRRRRTTGRGWSGSPAISCVRP